ncbi:hypothetical protein NKH18_40780 [Streptomyces sp. M10(2022)]
MLSVPVGEREADLFALRRSLFGERMQVRVECGGCGEAMEFDLDAGVLGVRPAPGTGRCEWRRTAGWSNSGCPPSPASRRPARRPLPPRPGGCL